MTAWLTAAEIEQLTERKLRTAQCRALAEMGIAFRASRTGRPLVERASVLRYGVQPKRAPAEPDWSALDQAA